MDKNKKTAGTRPVVMDATGKGDFDTTGRGSMLGTLDNPAANPAANQGSLRPGGSAAAGGEQQASISEEFMSIFEGQNLSEDFKTKAQVIFETVISEKVETIREQLVKESAKIIEEEVEKNTQDMATRLDEYLDYVVEEWMKDNKLAVESGIRTEVAESFMNGLRSLFESHYIEVPEAKHDLLEDLFSENQKLEESLNEQIKTNVELNKNITATYARSIFLETVSDMTQVDAERLASLAENIEFSTVEEFQGKLQIIKENYLKAAPVVAKETDTLTEQKEPVNVDGPMSVYVNALARQVKNN
jgi:hypothetical protein